MKAFLFFTFLLFQTFHLTAQETISAIELPQLNILYRGYNNLVKIAVSNSENCLVTLVGQNCSISEDSLTGNYIVRPGTAKVTYLTVNSYCNDSLVYSNTSEFRVSNLPDPSIYWGSSKSGNKAAIRSQLLQAKYPPEIPLKSQFTVRSWGLYHNGECKATGTGGNISGASEYLDSLTEPTSLQFKVIVQGPDGISRQIEATYTVDPTESQLRSVPTLKGCG